MKPDDQLAWLHAKVETALRDHEGMPCSDIADAIVDALSMHRERGRLRVSRFVTTWTPDQVIGDDGELA